MSRNRSYILIGLLTAASLTGALVLFTAGDDEEQAIAASPPTTKPTVAAPAPTPIDWDKSALGLSIGEQYTFTCPRSGTKSRFVWGTDIYTHDSSVCTAAVHAGLIDLQEGGMVVIEVQPGETSYLGTTANGVTTMSYGPWGRSFVFVD